MCVCVCVCVCVHASTRTHVCTHMHTYIHKLSTLSLVTNTRGIYKVSVSGEAIQCGGPYKTAT